MGCVLWQFPPGFVYSEDNLNKVVNALNHQFKNVVEFRHKSWWNHLVIEKLQSKNAVFCNPSLPDFSNKLLKITTVDTFGNMAYQNYFTLNIH
ncbi:DUF72 domain-containing protein [Myroides ceti]|uniref:DUF72 domain-containing protein n=1 Tax=Paenimyroides ceti TaxID=395087 RepID=A0ABT8D0F6_9FLAO|nr:DUF72 domain-containing protein [Paenimyroides ceti]MDN3709446.1 DUF72 domain-containing protein [Paenimyroides ceti]